MHDVLVLVRDCETWGSHVQYAADLASRLRGALTGIYVTPRSLTIPNDAPAAIARELLEICREEVIRARRADLPFMNWAAKRGVERAIWHVAAGAPVDVLEAAANWHDLAVLEAPAEPAGDDALELGTALLRAALPCVVVPRRVDKVNLDTIAIAWNGSAQSVRAVHAALPLLQQAQRVVALCAQRAGASACDWNEIDRFLDRHQVRCEHVGIEAEEHAAGAAILANCASLSADLLVLGAYGRTRFSEWFFGGVTRHVLEHATLPLFVRR